jgi:hypothetical protein
MVFAGAFAGVTGSSLCDLWVFAGVFAGVTDFALILCITVAVLAQHRFAVRSQSGDGDESFGSGDAHHIQESLLAASHLQRVVQLSKKKQHTHTRKMHRRRVMTKFSPFVGFRYFCDPPLV